MTTTLTPFERRIGDLDHPWYDDERTRFVSYEIYTVAFQMVWVALGVLLVAMEWAGNDTVAWWGLGAFAIFYLPLLYTGIRLKSAIDSTLARPRFGLRQAIFLVLYCAAILGFVQHLGGGSDGWISGMKSGLFPGAVVGGVTAIAAGWWKERRDARNRPDPADIPDED